MLQKKIWLIPLIFFLVLTVNTQFIQAVEPTDITNHWAQDYILNLLNNDIMATYSDGTFKPDQPITRGEFTLALAREMNLLPDNTTQFTDLQEYPDHKLINSLVAEKIINGYPDGTFRPDKPITKAEIVTIIIKSLGIKGEKETINLDNYQSFEDIPQNHWALNNIKIAEKLNLISRNQDNKFNPGKLITRAEAAKYLIKLENLSSNTGYITDVYPTSQKISINLLNGNRNIYKFTDKTLTGRNNRLITIDQILKTDKVFMITDANQEIKYLKAYGMITQDDLANEVSKMTNSILQPAEVKELAKGNVNILRPKLQTTIQKQLSEQGLTAEEVTAIMQTNWSQLETLSKERLAEAIAIQSGLPLDITRSLLEGDWEKIKTYAQIEIVQRMVQEVLNSDLIS